MTNGPRKRCREKRVHFTPRRIQSDKSIEVKLASTPDTNVTGAILPSPKYCLPQELRNAWSTGQRLRLNFTDCC